MSNSIPPSVLSQPLPTSLKRSQIPWWRLIVPLAIQVGLVVAIPGQAFYTRITGKTVILQTQPVDPYDWLRGYSQTLSYDISRWETLQNLPGWDELSSKPNQFSREFYLILERPQGQQQGELPQPWSAIAVSPRLPQNLPSNQIALRGRVNQGQLVYGLETYYMPEDQRQKINEEINLSQQQESQPFVVEIKVDDRGRSVLIQLCINNQCYQF
ncbi:MAG: GDYXXLXY domain-containing protein [Roseofilum sp. SBFL]|uniref:GDYXXLXY domain-containing protein n=1 Tax=unclassified Roseofilum TaxID=2620099 RepID=UPI001B03C458|nr:MULTISPECIES: GDYXXLXY domain-containing protein [unclassified Roseofilum]MBP0015089.1 GDYXXLXY domain-containing protein [Roseofilum sp. SID3]MBP0024293.1 GDYXXLXY domain-containing protein [Roseofilum sp. SID2]MBP0036530.1 GDYXXLXY domain-containing protein [Roseofilum sp. SID1]MBP0041537.1 GDYXXLXY domain-containing protein [Roseofilum sp. SBFL]